MRLRSFTFGAVVLATLPLGLGCEESVKDAREDVEDAKIEAQKDVMEEKQDVEEAAVEGKEKIEDEQAEVREAEVEEAKENAPN
jgi:hypothetical protein